MKILYSSMISISFEGLPNDLMKVLRIKVEIKTNNQTLVLREFEKLEGYHSYSHSVSLGQKLQVNFVIDCLSSEKMRSQMLHPIIANKAVMELNSAVFADPTFSDFTFDVQGKEFKLHKNILAAASPVMKKMFESESYEEGKTNCCTIKDIKPKIFEKLARFIYCGKIQECSDENWLALAEAAHYYAVPNLLKICEGKLAKRIVKENCLEIYWIALKLEMKNLIEISWKIVRR